MVPFFEKQGIKVKMNKSYPRTGSRIVSPLLKEAKALGVDAWVVGLLSGRRHALHQPVHGAGHQLQRLLPDRAAFLSQPLSKGTFGEQGVEGVMGGGAWNAKTSPGAKDLVEKFVAKFGEEPDYWGGLVLLGLAPALPAGHRKGRHPGPEEDPGHHGHRKVRRRPWGRSGMTRIVIFVNHPGEIGQWQKGVFEVIDPGEKRTAPPEYPKPPWPKKN